MALHYDSLVNTLFYPTYYCKLSKCFHASFQPLHTKYVYQKLGWCFNQPQLRPLALLYSVLSLELGYMLLMVTVLHTTLEIFSWLLYFFCVLGFCIFFTFCHFIIFFYILSFYLFFGFYLFIFYSLLFCTITLYFYYADSLTNLHC